MTVTDPFGAELLGYLSRRFPESTCTFATTLPARPAEYAPWPAWVPAGVRAALAATGITELYSHQQQCATAAYAGTHTAIATGTSSGKSLGYLLPILTTLATDPTACALYLTPTKALGSDQLLAIERLCAQDPSLAGIFAAPYDGDTPQEARAGIRDRARFILSNPDMVHHSLSAHHQQFSRFLRKLRFIVIDECHSYRGVFGAHISLVIRRLLRICAHYGANPTIIAASATMREPAAHAQRLCGLPFAEVTADGSPAGSRTIALWEPGLLNDPDAESSDAAGMTTIRRAASTEAAQLMGSLIAQGARTITFVRSRAGSEFVALHAAEELVRLGRPDYAARVAAYRAGYLAQDRRELERALDDGRLLGVASTSALELGIDIGGLDAVISAGFPGTVASFWQQAGRAGRRGQGSLVVLVGRDDPLDNYLLHHPDSVLAAPVEASVFNPANPAVLYDHLLCAAVELPLSDADIAAWHGEQAVAALVRDGLLRRRPRGWFAAAEALDNAHRQVALRGSSGGPVTIVDISDGRVLGTVDAARAPAQVHPGAVYVHQGHSFVIESLDLDELLALARPETPDYTTSARSTTAIEINEAAQGPNIQQLGPGVWLANVAVRVSTQVTGYVIRYPDGTQSVEIPLDFPAQELDTRAVAYTLDPLVLAELGLRPADIPGALHAAEHAAIGLLPLLATCDRWDIGGLSTARHPDTELPTVFVYDGHPGGAGFADEGYRRFGQWMAATYHTIDSCSCDDGCPACVQSPKCGNGNSPLSKSGARAIVGALAAMTGTV